MYESNPWIGQKTSINIKTFDPNTINSIINIFAEADLTKKCYITGKIYLDCLESTRCVVSIPYIDIEDIYFE